ncbi:hypothetical protein, partial [Parvibaculum sp.]|uniref:hypothetical protein n=1 Tax=Parvibaculum sp. TaxID=2024848 RepID=UPI0034A0988B
MRSSVASQGRRAGAGAVRTADRAALRAIRAAGAARRGTARGVSALTAPGTGRYWQSGSLASIGLSLGLVAAMSAASLWQAPGEAPAVNYVEGRPVPAVIRPFSDVELAQLRPVLVPLPRVAYQPPPRVAARSVSGPAPIDVDALPSRLMLPVAERRAVTHAPAPTAAAQV